MIADKRVKINQVIEDIKYYQAQLKELEAQYMKYLEVEARLESLIRLDEVDDVLPNQGQDVNSSLPADFNLRLEIEKLYREKTEPVQLFIIKKSLSEKIGVDLHGIEKNRKMVERAVNNLLKDGVLVRVGVGLYTIKKQ